MLEVKRLTREGVFFDVSLDVRAGEIVALAGLVGAGRSEVARAIFGIDKADAGHVEMAGKRLPGGRPLAAMRAGLGFVPEDRRQQGLVMDLSIARNVSLTRLRALSRAGLIRSSAENSLAEEWAARLQLKFHRLRDSVGTLSGGNQQKVVLGKWLATGPKVLIVDEPTRGIDVGTKAEVHRLMSELAGQGVAVLMISSELPEVLGMADRVLVMHEGRITGELSRAEANEESVIRLATGAVRGGRRRDAPAAAPLEGERARRLVERVFRIRELGIVVALALLIAVTGILEPRFIETASLRNLALNASIFAILAVGQTLVIITRNVDLSVGSVRRPHRVHGRRPALQPPGHARCRWCSSSGWGSAPPAGCSTASSRPGARCRRSS